MLATHNTLYARDTLGNVRTWRMERNGNQFRSVSGLLGGAQVESGWTVCEAKNVGRSNETSPEEQCLLEVESQYREKLRRKYHETQEALGTFRYAEPMLAQKFAGWEKLPGSRIFSQPKLDGYRCLGSQAGPYSRTGKRFEHMFHIEEALAPLFDRYPDAVLDGELYNHAFHDDFNELGGMIKRGPKTAADRIKIKQLVQYHVYDLNSSPETFQGRQRELREMCDRSGIDRDIIKLVDTTAIVNTAHLDEMFDRYLADNYEGQMVRLDEPYEFKRSKTLLKRKEFEDREFKLLRVEEGKGNWAGYAKRAVFALEDGRECGAGVKGSQAFAKQLLTNWQDFNQVTIRFFKETPDGFPRFPIATDWHKSAVSKDH